jgi:hypothetical protein
MERFLERYENGARAFDAKMVSVEDNGSCSLTTIRTGLVRCSDVFQCSVSSSNGNAMTADRGSVM